MEKTPDNIAKFKRKQPQGCRIAYTLNNMQPVRCTFIGEEPLFFMDYEEDYYADDISMEEAFGLREIEDGLASLQKKIERLDSLTEEFAVPAGRSVEQFFDDAAFITLPAREEDAIPRDIENLKTVLRKSRLAAAYLDFSAPFKTRMQYSRETEMAIYDRRNNTVLINPDQAEGTKILLAARELRRVWQHRNGALLPPLLFHPEQAILVNRAQIADLDASMVRIAWELQLAGHTEAWEHIENSGLEDLGRAFARESALDFRTLNNGDAASAVFEAWFLSERCCHEDKTLIQQMLADYQGHVFEQGHQAQSVTAELIFALGSMPFGKNYLAPYVSTIMNDAIFTEVRDRSNANFLWFIKFERSFRETERGLQKDQSVRRRELPDGGTQINKTKRIGHEETENIVSLPGGRESAPSSPVRAGSGKRRASARGRSGADIIAFPFGGPRQ